MNRPHIRYKKQSARQRTLTIHLISAIKVGKAIILTLVAAKLLSLFGRDVHSVFADFVTRHGIDLGNRFVQSTMEKLAGVGNSQLVEFSVVSLVYALLLFVEGIGLWLQKHWAEYLTSISTALLIPLEAYELFEKFTWVRIVLLIVNIFIVWYLITRLRDEKRRSATPSNIQTLIKICGITNAEDAQHAAECGADVLGFNFYKKSPRYVSPDNAASISTSLPDDVFKVGVFVDHSAEEIIEIVQIAGLDGVQLHGNETPEFVSELRNRLGESKYIIKAVRVGVDFEPHSVLDYGADAILLDAFSNDEFGGTGKTFDWEAAKKTSLVFSELYLAGGLSGENVALAIGTVGPFAVDAASLLESSPGKKDHGKVAAFIKAAKEAI